MEYFNKNLAVSLDWTHLRDSDQLLSKFASCGEQRDTLLQIHIMLWNSNAMNKGSNSK